MPIVDAAIAKEIKRHSEARDGEENEHKNDNLLVHFLNSVDENGQPFDRIYLRDMLMNFLLVSPFSSFSLSFFCC